ncbi:AraC family transcriptional regulator [Gracilibacillus sp. YIM 98692]|uniref:AraC family transcriptional regulator n=1 Tax=Gracilibacillus sp. YIM 98692 TaxID=2663532 RepID=UPI0013CFA048|nr:AraC family transcriptional regulator [Gracilibacillus sp. YIM 98692]
MANQHNVSTLLGEQFFSKPAFPFHIHQYFISKEKPIPPHNHDFFELVFVVEGNATHYMENQAYPLSAGNVFIIEPEVYHRFNPSTHQDTIVYNVLFSKNFLGKELAILNAIPSFVNLFYLIPFLRKNASFIPYLPLHTSQKIEIERHLDTIHHEYQEQEDGFELIIKTRLIEILVLLSRYHTLNQSDNSVIMSDKEAIHSITQYLKEHSDHPLKLSHLGQTYGMSVSSLTAKFKEHTGKTLIEYKHSVQIQYACVELQKSQKKIATIAFDCGFNDISHFNRIFKKQVGMTPKEYRAIH